jgi:hypothetical protein
VIFDIGHYGIYEFWHAMEGSSTNTLLGDLPEPSLYQVEPGKAGGYEVHMGSFGTPKESAKWTQFVGQSDNL